MNKSNKKEKKKKKNINILLNEFIYFEEKKKHT